MMQIQTVELLADLEEENAEHEHGDEDIQRNPELDDHRHAVGGAHGPEEEAVLHREKAHHLRHRLAPRNHRDEGQQDHGDGDTDGVARRGARERRDRLREAEGEHDDEDAHEHRARDVEQRLGVPVDLEAANEPVQNPGEEHHLEREGERRRQIQVMLPVRQARSSVAARSTAPCTARRFTRFTMRRCASIAKEMSSSKRRTEVQAVAGRRGCRPSL